MHYVIVNTLLRFAINSARCLSRLFSENTQNKLQIITVALYICYYGSKWGIFLYKIGNANVMPLTPILLKFTSPRALNISSRLKHNT